MTGQEKALNMEEASALEVKVISCRHLKAFNFFQKLSVYAAVSIFRDESKSSDQQQAQVQLQLQRQKTPVDRDGGSRPEWNHRVSFDVRDIDLSSDRRDGLFLRFELRCEGVVYGKKCIGEVRVPFKDLVDEFTGTVRFVSYQVRSSEGRPNGVLNFSYKFVRKVEKAIGNDGSGSESDVTDREVQYPTVDRCVKTPARDRTICYPSLEEVQSSCTGLISYVPAPRHGGGAVAPQPHTAARDAFYHLYHDHLPVLQSQGPYKYVLEAARYGQSRTVGQYGAGGADAAAGLYAGGR